MTTLSPFARGLIEKMALYWRNLAKAIEEASFEDAADFAYMIRFVLKHTDVQSVTLADRTQMSTETLARWASGQVSPHPIMRRSSQKEIAADLRERADALDWLCTLKEGFVVTSGHLQEIAAHIKNIHVAQDREFAAMVSFATSCCGIEPGALAGAFGVDLGTISRWKEGHNLPQIFARRTVCDWVVHILLLRARALKHESPACASAVAS